MIFQIVRNTPVWVFAVFAYLAWMGIKRLSPGVYDVRRIWITPAIFIAWGLLGLAQRGGPFETTLMEWLMGAVVGAVAGAVPAQQLVVDHARRRVLQPACATPLIRNLLLFGAHYGLNVAAAVNPAIGASLMRWDIAVSGLGAGYFAGWAIRFVRSYRSAPDADLGGEDLHLTKLLAANAPSD